MLTRTFAMFLFFGLISGSLTGQDLSWQEIRTVAAAENKKVLLVFSGSDWCRGCILFDRQVLQDSAFQELVQKNVAMYKADFPRKKKNKPAVQVIRQNEQLIQRYNPSGTFPFVLLLDDQDEILLKAEGTIDPDAFLDKMQKVTQ